MQDLEKAVIKTLCYADVFDYPLTEAQVHRFLIGMKTNEAKLKKTSLNLCETQRIVNQEELYCLPHRETVITLRKKRETYTEAKRLKAQKYARYLASIPTIKGVFLTGGLAMNNADREDDIDFLVITQAQTLWRTRLLVAFLLQLLGVRRKAGDVENQDRICVNMYLDELALAVPASKRDLYTAHEIVQMEPLINKNNIYERVLNANRWIDAFLPNISLPTAVKRIQKIGGRTPVWEQWVYSLQKKHMQSRMTRELVTPHMAYFHPRDTGATVMQQYKKRRELFL